MKGEVKSNIHLGQWFLWLQEKSLFGFAALLCNNTPGVKFRAGDLVKNLLMSAFIEKPMPVQEKLYADKWIQPIQNHVSDLDDFLKAFLKEENFKEVLNENSSERYISKYEKQILAMINTAGTDDDSDEDQGCLPHPALQKAGPALPRSVKLTKPAVHSPTTLLHTV